MGFSFFSGESDHVHSGFNVQDLFKTVDNAVTSAKAKLLLIKNNRSSISIGDMFEMQMLMNHLSQLSEMSTSIVSSANSAISRMAQNIK
jgi:hypothetical protein